MTTTTALETGVWTIDPVHSSIEFWVRHLVVSKVRGLFPTVGGTITVGANGTGSVEAEIDVASINTGNAQRDEHLKSPQFFDAGAYPKASFISTALRPEGERYVLDGQFTLKGVTKPISLDLDFYGVSEGMGGGPVAGFEASVVLSRKDFGIDIDMPMQSGGAVIGDKVSVTINVEAVRQ